MGFEPGYSRSSFRKLVESEGIVRGIEAAWTRRDGSLLFVRESARAVRGADGSVLYYDGIVEDIKERKWAEDTRAGRPKPPLRKARSASGIWPTQRR